MAASEPTVFAQALGIPVLTAATRTGREPAQLCAELGVEPQALADPAARLAHGAVFDGWARLARQVEDLGLHAALLVSASSQSLVEYAMVNAGTVRGALAVFLRFQGLLHQASAHVLEERGEVATVRFGLRAPLRLPEANWHFLAATLTLRLRALAAVEPKAVRLPGPPFANPALGRDIFRAPVEHGTARPEVVLPRAALERPVQSADPRLHALLVRQLEVALGLPGAGAEGGSVLSAASADALLRLKAELRRAIPRNAASLGEVARAMAVGPRSLQRELARRGTTYQQVLDDVRRALALELLERRGASVSEAALCVGFSELAAFSRAFRRWTQLSPTEYLRRRDAGT